MRRERHGLRRHPLYSVWANMKTRFTNVNDAHFERWGGRGITVCDEWLHSFQAFYTWAMSNGYVEGLTIDRVDTNGDYSPDNCRWIPMEEQSANRRCVKHITYHGRNQTIPEWTKELGLGKETIRERLKRGWTEIEAIEGKRVIK